MSDDRVLITGGAGFIGARLAAAHAADGDEVHVLVRPRSVPLRPLPRTAVVTAVRLDDAVAVTDHVARVAPTLVYHLASDTGRDTALPRVDDRDRLVGDLDRLLILLAALDRLAVPPRALVRAGSLAEYGDGPTPSSESQREAPRTPYATAMVAGAHFCAMLQPAIGFPVRTARLGLAYGPGQSDSFFLPWLIRRCLDGESSVVRNPDNRRDMVHVDDIVRGLRLLATSTLPGGSIVNLCTGRAPTIRSIAQWVGYATRCDPSLIRFDPDPSPSTRVTWVRGSPDHARRLLGWSATQSIEAGIVGLVEPQRATEAA